jgi:hypothetical protein
MSTLFTTELFILKRDSIKEEKMKRTIVFSLVFLMVFTIGLSAKVKVIPGTYSTANGDFYTKFWKELFKGGFPGQPGNVIMALGEGYILNQAKLVTVEASNNAEYTYMTTYAGGMMTLNPSGPWCDSGTLKAKNITAVNYSSQNPVLTGILKFYLKFEGEFDNAPGYHFVGEAWYEGQPEVKYDELTGQPSFQRGMDYEVTITITGPVESPKKTKPKE